MTLEWVVTNFGYPAVVIGTFFEGEIILILAGFAAHRGYLDLPLVILAAFLGGLSGDQFYFFLGRHRGRSVLAKHPGWEARIDRFKLLLDRYDVPIIMVFRFLYGFRTVAPIAIGLSDISPVKFFILNCISVAVWAVTVGVLGYVFGHAMEIMIDEIKRYEIAVMSVLFAAALIVFIVKRYKHYKSRKK